MSNFILGIDQGTTSTRAALMGADGKLINFKSLRHEQFFDHPGWVEHDALEIWKNTLNLIEQVGSELPSGDSINGIAIANQGETVVFWDKKTGHPISRAIVWQDTRTEKMLDRFSSSEKFEIKKRTGLRLDSYFSALKIAWCLSEIPDTKKLLQENRLCVGTLDSWLVWKLTSGSSFVTDVSTASRTLLLNIHTLDYDEYLLKLFGIPRGILPQILPCDAHFGEIKTGEKNTIRGLPIVASLVDQPASLFGMALNKDELKITYGTGCFVYKKTSSPSNQNEHLLTSVGWQLDGHTTFVIDSGVFAVGSVFEWLKRLGLAHANEIPEQINQSSNLPIFIPSLVGLEAPYWNRNFRGSWLGLELSHTREELIYSVMEGIALRVVQICQLMEKNSAFKVRVDGGLSQSKPFMQLQANLLGLPIEVVHESESTLKGISFFGLCALNEMKEIDIPNQITCTYEPQLSDEERQQKLVRFERAIQNMYHVYL